MKSNFKLEDNKTFLYTKGNQFSLDFKEYIGEYHYQGNDAYTGPEVMINSKKLSRYNKNLDIMIYDNIKPITLKNVTLYVEPEDCFVEPTENNYIDGYFIRYYVKRRNGIDATIYEINSDEVSRYGKPGGIDPGLYQLEELIWNISKSARYPDSIQQQNMKNILTANKKMSGLVDIHLNYFEFSYIVI